jgi:hypothetical protein
MTKQEGPRGGYDSGDPVPKGWGQYDSQTQLMEGAVESIIIEHDEPLTLPEANALAENNPEDAANGAREQ